MISNSERDPYSSEFGNRATQDEDIFPDIVKIAPSWPISGPSGVVITDEGIVIVDTGVNFREGQDRVQRIRERTNLPFHTIIFSHGHVDHVGGAPAFLADAEQRGHTQPRIIGHSLVARRLDKYRMLAGRRAYIASLQFPRSDQAPITGQDWSSVPEPSFIYPDTTFHDEMEFRLGGLTFEIRHSPAETDDGVWVWIPERKVAFIGDLLINGCPNTGNPLKEQRYTLEWAENLEIIAEKKPDFVISSGPVVSGQDVEEMLLNTAKLLRFIQEEVVRFLNCGYWIEEILEKIKIPEELTDKPYLRGNYGHPIFIIHDVFRRYTGWYNGNPSDLFPSPTSKIAIEVLRFTSPEQVLARANQLQQEGNIQLALHLTDFVINGCDDIIRRNEAINLKASLLDARATAIQNYIAGNIMRTSAGILRDEAV